MSANGTPKTMDQRIDVLTANVASLRETAKDLAFSQKLQADMLVPLDSNMEKLTANVDKLTGTIELLVKMSSQDAESINALDTLAVSHCKNTPALSTAGALVAVYKRVSLA